MSSLLAYVGVSMPSNEVDKTGNYLVSSVDDHGHDCEHTR